MVPAHEPERVRRWSANEIVDVRDTSRGLRLMLVDGQEVMLTLGRSSEDERKLADEVIAAIGLPWEERG